MTKKTRRKFTPQEKVVILKQHLLEGKAVSDVCDAHGLNPNVFYRWQKEFFENGAAAFEKTARIEIKRKAKDGTPRYPDLGDVIDPVTGQHAFQIGHGGPELVALSAAALLFWPAALLPATIGLIEAERFQAVARFIAFLKKRFKGSGTITVAAPGLSAHGTGRAIDFRVHDRSGKKLHGAGGAANWRSSGFAAQLKAVMAVVPHFHGPLTAPDEPWHYFFDPDA